VAGGAVALLALVAVVVAAILQRDEAAPVVVPPNFVAAIDPATNEVTTTLQAGTRPGPVAGGAGSIWVGNLDGRSLTRIDPDTGTVVDTIHLTVTPTAIAAGRSSVWVVNGRLGSLYRVDPEFAEVSDPVDFDLRSIRYTGAGIDLGEGSVWTAFGESILARANPTDLTDASAVSTAGAAPAGLVVAYRYVWVANSEDATVRLYSRETWDVGEVGSRSVCRGPSGIAAGEGSIWVACTEDDRVARLPADVGAGSYEPIPVGDGPTSVAFGAGAVWVANTRAGTVSRIDPETNDVETIEVGNAPAGIAVFDGLVWVSVQAPVGDAPTS
jgi:YVTN family beta-propeller protein